VTAFSFVGWWHNGINAFFFFFGFGTAQAEILRAKFKRRPAIFSRQKIKKKSGEGTYLFFPFHLFLLTTIIP
jgi:hypothetical protein